MIQLDLHNTLAGPWSDGTRPKDLFRLHISSSPEQYLPAILAGLASKDRRIQGGSAELASLLSEQQPELVYPHAGLFVANLRAKQPILRWEAVCTLGNLASIDEQKRIPPHLEEFVACLVHESIVLQGHAVRALGKLARANPALAPTILDALIDAQNAFPKNRIGFVIETMPVFAEDPQLRTKARAFVEKWTSSDINVVASKARKAAKELSDKAPQQRRRSPKKS